VCTKTVQRQVLFRNLTLSLPVHALSSTQLSPQGQKGLWML
jgi:hypothetical protein